MQRPLLCKTSIIRLFFRPYSLTSIIATDSSEAVYITPMVLSVSNRFSSSKCGSGRLAILVIHLILSYISQVRVIVCYGPKSMQNVSISPSSSCKSASGKTTSEKQRLEQTRTRSAFRFLNILQLCYILSVDLYQILVSHSLTEFPTIVILPSCSKLASITFATNC
jgi:hypothetical protein